MALFDYSGSEVPERAIEDMVFLEDFSPADWSRILAFVETRPFTAGQALVKSGEIDDALYILSAGEVDVVVSDDPERGETVLARLAEGAVFGEVAFFDAEPRSATIRARTPGSAIRVTRTSFDTLAAWEPLLARRMLFELGRVLAHRLRWTTKTMGRRA